MKRSGFKQKQRVPLKRSGFKKKEVGAIQYRNKGTNATTRRIGLRRTKGLRMRGVSETSVLKEMIQNMLRLIVIKRDGGCILRKAKGVPVCNGYRNDGDLILQADHLVDRGNSATYADSRLVVCVCKGHHGWKSVGNNLRKNEYDEVVRKLISPERRILWKKCQDARSAHFTKKMDWKMELLALETEYKKLCTLQ